MQRQRQGLQNVFTPHAVLRKHGNKHAENVNKNLFYPLAMLDQLSIGKLMRYELLVTRIQQSCQAKHYGEQIAKKRDPNRRRFKCEQLAHLPNQRTAAKASHLSRPVELQAETFAASSYA